MGVLAWIVLGGIAGWIASIITGEDAGQNWPGNIVVGMVGALVGGLMFNALGGVGITGLNVWNLIVAVVGSTILLMVVQLFTQPEH